ncbi:MAG: hemagglutinin repeat-containing protein, partial [Eubacterium aggregans]
NKSSGHANGNGLEWTNTHLLAGNTLSLISGNDLTLRGATARGDTLLASVGGNLIIESLQDTDNYKSEQKSSGFSLSIPLSMGGRPSASISKGQTDIDSNYRSVIEQSALKAGDGGFNVNVGGDTTLIGGAILSTQKAIDQGNNHFNIEGELTLVDLKNKAEYEGTSYSVNLGSVPSTDGKLTPDGSSFGYGKESGEASSTTYAAISGIAGKEEARTGDKESGIEKIFDADEVERKLKAKVEAMQKFGELAPKAAADFADKQARQLLADAGNETDQAKQAAMIEEAKRWGEGGAYRVALHTALGGLAGGMEGALGAGATAQAASILGQLQDSLATSLKNAGMEGSLADAAGSLIAKVAAAGLGSAVGGMPGAGMGLNVEANNRQLHDNEIAWLEKNAKKFAEEQGISEQEAMVRLAQQAMKDVDFMWRAVLKDGNDDAAKEFLGKTEGTFINDLGENQKLFTTSGQQVFRPEMFGDTADPAFYKAYVQSGISRSLSDGLQKEFKDMGIDLKDSAVGLYELAKEHPWEFVKGIADGITHIPKGVVDSFQDTGHAIGEGAAVALNEELAAKLQAIYAVDPSAYQQAALLIRVVGSVMGAAGTAKAGAKVTEAVGKKLDDIAEAAAKKKEGAGGAGNVPDIPKDLPKNPLLEDAIPRNGDRLVVNQGNNPTCGHNSCGMVLDTMGKQVDIESLVKKIPPSTEGIYSTDVAQLLKSEGVRSTAFSNRNVADLTRYTANGTPVIVRIADQTTGSGFSHFVVVDGVTTRNGLRVVAIRDPNGMQYFSPVATFEKSFTGEVILPKR